MLLRHACMDKWICMPSTSELAIPETTPEVFKDTIIMNRRNIVLSRKCWLCTRCYIPAAIPSSFSQFLRNCWCTSVKFKNIYLGTSIQKKKLLNFVSKKEYV